MVLVAVISEDSDADVSVLVGTVDEKLGDVDELAEAAELVEIAALDDTSELDVSTELVKAAELDDTSELDDAGAVVVLDTTELDNDGASPTRNAESNRESETTSVLI